MQNHFKLTVLVRSDVEISETSAKNALAAVIDEHSPFTVVSGIGFLEVEAAQAPGVIVGVGAKFRHLDGRTYVLAKPGMGVTDQSAPEGGPGRFWQLINIETGGTWGNGRLQIQQLIDDMNGDKEGFTVTCSGQDFQSNPGRFTGKVEIENDPFAASTVTPGVTSPSNPVPDDDITDEDDDGDDEEEDDDDGY